MEEFWEAMREVETLYNVIKDAVERALAACDGWMQSVSDALHEAWAYFTSKVEELWSWLSSFAECPGDVTALKAAAVEWNEKVGLPVSSQAGRLEAGQLGTDDLWTGVSADRYRQALSGQQKAISTIRSEFVDAASTALCDVAGAIMLRWIALAAASAVLIAALIQAAATTAAVFTAPAGPFFAAGGVLIFLATCWGAESNLNSACDSAKSKMIQAITDLTAYPNGHWPQALG